MSTYAPEFLTIPCVKGDGTAINLIDAAIYGRHFRPEPFVIASGLVAPEAWGTFGFADGYINQPYLQQWYIENQNHPVVYSVISGTLPPGLSLFNIGSTAEGEISGTPTTVGAYTFTLRATGPTLLADKSFTITIHDDPDEGTAGVGGG